MNVCPVIQTQFLAVDKRHTVDMRFAAAVTFVGVMAGCSPRYGHCVQDPRGPRANDDTSRGVPSTVFRSAQLVSGVADRDRKCQVVFEPSFSVAHALWFTQDHSGDATAVVSILVNDGTPERYSASLDGRTARMLDSACARFLKYRPSCQTHGVDGTYVHIAHSNPGRGYAMRTLWSPCRDSVDARFVALAESLRAYVVVPPSLRALQWMKVNDSAGKLDDALTAAGAR